MKYKEGDFGYWWTIEEGNEDIENKILEGDIDCSFKNLTSLKGSPKIIEGYFNCNFNKLKTLKGSPIEVRGYFDCSLNYIITLEGCPEKVGSIDFSNNPGKHIKEEFNIRKENPKLSESEILDKMFQRTNDKSYLSNECNNLFM